MAQTTTDGGDLGVARAPRWVGITIVAVGLLGIAGYLVVALARVGYPYELAFFEGSTIEVTARVVDGQALYGPPSAEFTPWPYPPMYFWLTAAAADLLGLDLPAMRWVSLIASVAVLGLIAMIVHRMTGSRLAALLGAGLYAGTYRVAGAWADTARVDSVFLAWLMAAVAMALRARTWRSGVATGVLFGAAFLTKQNALIVAAPVLVALVLRHRSAGIAASATVLGIAVGSVVAGDVLTDGWYSPYVVAQLLGHPVALEWFGWFWFVDVALPLLLLAGVVGWLTWRAGAARMLAPRGHGSSDRMIFGAAALGLLLAGWAGRLHEGGTANVAMPTHIAASLILAVAVHWLVTAAPLTRRGYVALSGALVAQMIVLLLWRTDLIPTQADRTAGDRMIQELAASPGYVMVVAHPYYSRLAGSPSHASAIAVADLLKSRPSRARDSLAAQLPWSLDGIDTVVADSPANAAGLGPELAEQFTLVEADLTPGDVFLPVTDFPTKPTLVYVRTSELSR
jgi:4-amino-4-deoxy-L-arabinose transferase-like glycosyltransferase